MSRLSNEILNKYIDGELDENERTKVANQIEFSEEDRKQYAALLSVHSTLKNIKPFLVSDSFTSQFMYDLMKKYKARKEQKIFILSVSSVFILISLIIVGLLISWFISSQPEETTNTTSVLNALAEYFNYSMFTLANGFSKNISIIGSVISLGILITAYFFFDNVKESKERLKKLNS